MKSRSAQRKQSALRSLVLFEAYEGIIGIVRSQSKLKEVDERARRKKDPDRQTGTSTTLLQSYCYDSDPPVR